MQLTCTICVKPRVKSESKAAHTKQVRQIYTLSMLLSCTNNPCSCLFISFYQKPFFAKRITRACEDAQSHWSGSVNWHHQRHLATQVSQEQRAHGIKPECTPKALTALSICNNSLQPHALICFKQRCYLKVVWNICTVCATTSHLMHYSITEKNHIHQPQSWKQPTASKIASPILVESKCCCHTLKELQSPLYTVTIPDATSSLAIHSSVTGDYHMSSGNLAISDFHLTPWKGLVSSAWEMTCWNACS